MRSSRIAATPWLRSRADLRAVSVLAGAPHRVLRSLTGPWITPELSPRLPHLPALGGLVRALGGRMIVDNPNVVARLPRDAGVLAAAVLAARLDGSLGAPAGGSTPFTPHSAEGGRTIDTRDATDRRRITALLAELPEDSREALRRQPPAAWAAAALLEPAALDVRLAGAGGGEPTAPARFIASPRYRLLLAAGTGEPPEWDALEAAGRGATAVSWPPAREEQAWFFTSLLVPDAMAADDMNEEARAHWGAVTGRAGPSSRDRYWFADSWERFREPGRRIGHVTPQLVSRSRRLRSASEYDVGGALALTPDFERGTSVPPGYCLVDCIGTLEVALLTY